MGARIRERVSRNGIVAILAAIGAIGTALAAPEGSFDQLLTAMGMAEPDDEPIAGNRRNDSYNEAKRALEEVYAGRRTTFYCGCSFDERKRVDHASCGYDAKRPGKRASRVEWEHVVPADAFGHSFPEWRKGHPECVDNRGKPFKGRNCARKMSVAFRRMEADMYNLVPSIGEVNARRSNYSMAMIDGEEREFGACDLEIADHKIEPRREVRGDVARTYHYMNRAYPRRGVVSRKNRGLFEAWAQEDPVDRWECERARAIAQVQGNVNVVVEDACKEAGL